ncbi:MAG: undecaprenyl-phosphate glucose phosphotransferase [Moritella sp.]|uniref:undecaprenyl-phosphate glucose phosphotransferase n=1 Tax=Moritella sp. TaxID=78556 RepID=UPI001DAD3352|nr:undecaprenyl-phosphate glucose phosphotransferase [Moritella sp.]NQZ52166.1 undecaprenyl-phosphate glucose phosphotransferase [Moritella sp.]
MSFNGSSSSPDLSPSTIIYTGNKSGNSARPRRLLRRHESVLLLWQVFLNCMVISIALFVCTFLKLQDLPSIYRMLLVNAVFLVVVIYPMMGVYKQAEKFHTMALRITVAWVITVMTLVVIAFLTKTSEQYSREVMITWFLLVAFLQVPFLKLNYLAVAYYRKKHTKPINSIVIGLGRTARFFSEKLDKNHWLPDKIVGMVNGYERDVPDSITKQLTFPLLGELQNIQNIVKTHQIKRIYISLPLKHAAKVEALNEELLDSHVDVIWILDVSDWKLMNHSVREVAGMPLLSLNESPQNVSRIQIRIKHLLDKIIAICMLIALFPLLLVATVAVEVSSPGPVLFKQKRHGFDGEEISIFKFRSMRLHDDKDVKQAQKGDDRITKVGAFLRKTSIDELPQLLNVLQGSMSLVGPRPHAVAHNQYYSDKISKYMARHRIKPGITGLAQISGCRGETETIDKMEDRVKYDMEYINNWSLIGDFKILIKTPLSLIGKDIY